LKRAFYVPLEHRYLGAPPQLSQGDVLAALKVHLADPKKEKVAHESKRVRHLLSRNGIEVAGFFGDTAIANYLLNPERTNQDLAVIAQELLDHTIVPWELGLGKGGKTVMGQVPVEQALQHAAEIAHITFLVSRRLDERLKEVGKLEELYRKLEIPIVPVLAKMEAAGVCIDAPLLERLSREYEIQIREVEAEVYEAAGQNFNIGSPLQLRQILFEKMNRRRTRTCSRSSPSATSCPLSSSSTARARS
jgi:DNA polymerase-1